MKIHPFQPSPPPPIVVVQNIHNDDYSYFSWDVRCQFWWWKYKRLIGFIAITTLLVTSVTITVITLQNSSASSSTTTSTNPCDKYRVDDLANSVSLECFRSLWERAGCLEKGKGTVPNGYNGWWLRSPSGGKTVACIPPHLNERCGAGNYGTIINNLWVCDLDYRGY